MKASKKFVSAIAAVSALALGLAGCSGDSGDSADGAFKIGVTQIITHPALDAIVDGFQQALEDAGVEATYDLQNAQGESSNAATIAGAFKEDTSIDLVLAVATPTAVAVAAQITDRPIVFAGITDPVDAGLVSSLEPGGANISGASDKVPAPVALIKEILPNVSTIGVLYSSGEANSVVQVNDLKAAAAEHGIEVVESAITNSSEVATGVQALSGVDAIFVPTDNTVVASLENVIAFAQSNQIPLFPADVDSVVRGGVATQGIDYWQHGYKAGELAVKVLKDGVDIGTLATIVEDPSETTIYVNKEAAAAQGVTLSDSLLERAEEATASEG